MKKIKRLNEDEEFGLTSIPDEELRIAEEAAKKINYDPIAAKNIIITLLKEVDMATEASEIGELLDDHIRQKSIDFAQGTLATRAKDRE